MKKLLMFLCAVTFVFGMVGSAKATSVTFDVDGPSDSYVNFTSITTVGWTSLSATLAGLDTLSDFTLEDNESNTIDFFTFSVTGWGGGGVFKLGANLNFDSPYIDAGGGSSGAWASLGGCFSGGVFLWDNAVQEFSLADGNTIRIAMEDGFTFGADSDITIHATITNLGSGGTPAPVPEPATILLMGAGLLGLVGYNRKRLIKKS